MHAKLIQHRTRPIAELQLNRAQFGFIKGKECTLRQICESTTENNHHQNIVFIDQEKALDRVDMEKN
jgi:hypothetical protein